MEITHKSHFNILYIGGDVSVIKLLSDSDYFSVEVKENSLSAVRWLNSSKKEIDAVLCEMYTPGINAFEIKTLFNAKNIIQKQPFIVISHKDDPALRISALNERLDDFITVPIDLEHIKTRLDFLYWYKLNYE